MAYGLRYDLRLVVSYVRMTVGVDFPFPSYRAQDTRGSYDIAGIERQLTVQDIQPYELRFGIGGEYPIAFVAPFLDILGTAHWVDTTLSVDGESVTYKANSFGFAIRAGCRIHLRRWFFIVAAGEIGLVGDVYWGAELSVGFALGSDD